VLIVCSLDLLFDPFRRDCEGVEGLHLCFAVEAYFLEDVGSEGEEVEEKAAGRGLGVIDDGIQNEV
jgi:hypothetical protein